MRGDPTGRPASESSFPSLKLSSSTSLFRKPDALGGLNSSWNSVQRRFRGISVSDMTFDYAVVGKGLVGSAAARYLSESAERVAIIGPDEPADWHKHTGPFASHYDEGRITRVLDPDPIWALLAQRSIREYGAIERASGITFHHPVGTLRVATGGNGEGGLAGIEAIGRRLQVEFDVLGPEKVPHACPQLSFPAGRVGLLERGGAGYINPRALIQAQLRLSATLGASTIRKTVTAIAPTRESVELYTDGGDRYRARKVLVANGAYVDQLLGEKFNLTLVGRTILLAEVSKAEAARLQGVPALIYKPKPYATVESIYMVPPVPYPDGKHYVKIGGLHSPCITLASGAELQEWFSGGVYQAEARAEVEALTDVLLALVPTLKVTTYRWEPCVTSETADNRPLIQSVEPGRLFVAAGGCGASAKSSNEIGRLAARLVQNGQWTDDPYGAEVFTREPGR